MQANRYRLGVDIGGTFTDVVLIDDDSGELLIQKTPSTPRDPHIGVMRGTDNALRAAQRQSANCSLFVHGTTIGINTLLERSGDPVGLLVTKGFKDLLEIGRMRMPDPYNLNTQRIDPLIRRSAVEEVNERIDASGKVVVPLDFESVLSGVAHLSQKGISQIAICFLNAYRNDRHELEAKKLILQRFPDTSVAISSEVWPQVREYERAIATVINTYIARRVQNYLASLEEVMRATGMAQPLYVTVSNGGNLPAALVKNAPILSLISGPAAGVVGAAHMARVWDVPHLLTFDMGGTSTDIAVIRDGQVPITTQTELGGFPIVLPCVDVHSVGAGGGSIARLDSGGMLKVGPTSAGAEPGPACYAKGGKAATVTDAYVIAGIIAPDNFLGGSVNVDPELSRVALSELGERASLNLLRTTDAILRITTSNCVAEISRLATRTGIDPRDFSMLAYGGAGPTHASLVAEEMGITHVIVPAAPGTFCAWGALMADLRMTFVKSVNAAVGSTQLDAIRKWHAATIEAAMEMLASWEAVRTFRRELAFDMRYEGQGFDVDVSLDPDDLELSDAADRILTRFHTRYRDLYGVNDPSMPVDLMNVRLTVIGETKKPVPMRCRADGGTAAPAGQRLLLVDGKQRFVPVFRRAELGAGVSLRGPCLIDQVDTTTLVLSGWQVQVGTDGTLFLHRYEDRDAQSL